MANAVISSSARRYAEAAFAVAKEAGAFDPWLTALDELSALLGNRELEIAVSSPAIDASAKRAMLLQLAPSMSPMVQNFVAILAARDRLGQLPHIAQAFRERVNHERGILTAEVTTAVPLDEESSRMVAQRLGSHFQHDPARLAISPRVDPNIIGGVVARVGDKLIDDSVRGRLDRLRRTLAANGR